MSNDELRVWLLLIGFELVPGTDGIKYIYADEHGLRCRIYLSEFIYIGWVQAHPLNYNRISGLVVTPEAAFKEITQWLAYKGTR